MSCWRTRVTLAGLLCAAVVAATAWASPAVANTRTPVELTPVTKAVASPPRWYDGNDGRVHLQYELMLTNTVPLPVNVTSVEVRGNGRVIESLSGDRLVAAMSPLGSETGASTTLPASSVGVVWVDLGFPSRRALPARVSHRLTVDVGEGLPVGPIITSTGGRAAVTPHQPVVIGPPLAGGRWVAIGGPAGPHRRALQAVDGRLWLSQRFALDFSALLDRDGRTHAGDPGQNSSYFNYGQPVLAVGAGTIVEAVDRYPDQVPNHHVSLPTEQQDGNHVILKLADGVYAGYAHLEPGSVRVRAGDHVRAGQVLGRLGNTGASTGPHLHFQVMDHPSIIAADGLPFEFSKFTFDGALPSLDGFLDADKTGTSVPIDPAGAGARHRQGEAGLGVLTFPGNATAPGTQR